jgi:hypothetical protein
VLRLTVASVLALIAFTTTPTRAEEIGECRFDRDSLTFAGTPLEQATCLLRKIDRNGGRSLQPLPPVIVRLMRDGGAPSAAQQAAALAAFPEPYRTYARDNAGLPLSQTEQGLPALYFVIHHTRTPFFGDAPFPPDLDDDPQVNSFEPYMDGSFAQEPVAHIFLNRQGQIWAGHDFSTAWRATKLESRVIGPRARGRFVHIETVQPHRNRPRATAAGQTEAPRPGFTRSQYRMLAALYVYASARAGHWLIPAQHNTVDATIPEAHDDPQNFELKDFGKELDRLLKP